MSRKKSFIKLAKIRYKIILCLIKMSEFQLPISHISSRSEKDVKSYMGAGISSCKFCHVKPYLLSLKEHALLNFIAVVVPMGTFLSNRKDAADGEVKLLTAFVQKEVQGKNYILWQLSFL